jgi:CRP/FNR family transcriptional regulator, cyclic AMP receptor protein
MQWGSPRGSDSVLMSDKNLSMNFLQEIFRSPDLYVPFKAGQAIFKEGEQGDVMYVLMEGEVEVKVHDKSIGTFLPIEVFGEMAVIDPHPRSATVIAKTDCRLAPINQKRFLFLIQQKPQFAIYIMKILVERIRWMDSMAKSTTSAAVASEQAG